jgi:hypothetical protein
LEKLGEKYDKNQGKTKGGVFKTQKNAVSEKLILFQFICRSQLDDCFDFWTREDFKTDP